MSQINVSLNDYKNAPDGSLLIKKDGKFVPVSYKDLNKENENKQKEIDVLKQDLEVLKESNKHFKVYAKSHFMVAYNYVMGRLLLGEISVEQEFITLAERVMNDEIKVEDAIKEDKLLEQVFNKLYVNNSDTVVFSEV